MIVITLSIILCLIFTTLGIFHFYWFFGGVWGLNKVIPTKTTKFSSLSIPKVATLMVGLAFIFAALIYLIKPGLINVPIPNWLINYGCWFIPAVFILRAIGEFNYVGFFKKIKDTEFAKADSKIFSPLCLSIGIIGVLIQLITK